MTEMIEVIVLVVVFAWVALIVLGQLACIVWLLNKGRHD